MDQKYFTRRPDINSFLVVSFHIALILSPLFVSAVLGPSILLFFCWVFFGVGMNGLINLMHECCHYLVFKDKKGSEFLGRYILAPMAFADFDSYQQRHWAHHKFLGVEGETKDTYHIDIHGRSIGLLLLRCLLGLEALSKFKRQIISKEDNTPYKASRGWMLRILLFQTLLFFSLVISAHSIGGAPWKISFFHAGMAYVFVYFYGLMSWTTFMADLRAIAEHQIYDDHDTTEGEASLRNMKCNFFSRFCLGAYGFGEHYTHHEIPGIPYYALPKATDELAQTQPQLKPEIGYFGILIKLWNKKNKP